MILRVMFGPEGGRESARSIVTRGRLGKVLNHEPKRVNVDFPTWVVEGLDREARRLGVTRQALIKLWIAERLPQR
ncbi:MAG: hypothetical protein EOP19_28300 [Hyphomicrobiales bacterium]|nr:MAG: hypothetical protein EOP19_28300 [Hyphomicrobiales bacterium]